MSSNNLELLAPAGNFKILRYAFEYGADAAYIGIKALSLRVKENEFTIESLKQAIDYAHNLNKKIYITTNVYPRHMNEQTLIKYFDELASKEPDAFIISDPGLVMLVNENFDIPVHLSVQANTTNPLAAKFWYKNGVERIILARELSLQEIKAIHDYVPEVELEFFVHGSICMTYSGRCLLSAYMAKRNPNQGVCAHSCRWKYKVYIEELQRPGELMPIEEDEHGTYILNSKDLNMLYRLKELIDAGIISFKIEGRNKTEYYVATVTRAYRKALDAIIEGKEPNYNELMYELKAAPNRGFIESYLDMPTNFDAQKSLQNYKSAGSQQTHNYVAEIEKIEQNKAYVKIKNKISIGDEIEIFDPKQTIKTKIVAIHKDMERLKEANPGTQHTFVLELKHNIQTLTLPALIRKKKAILDPN